MKRMICLTLLVAILTCIIGTATGDTWLNYSSSIIKNSETMIKTIRETYDENGGKLTGRSIEVLYRYYQLWISAKQVYAMASVDFNTIVIMDNMDAFATSQQAAAETWMEYLKGEISAEKMAQLLIILTDEIEK